MSSISPLLLICLQLPLVPRIVLSVKPKGHWPEPKPRKVQQGNHTATKSSSSAPPCAQLHLSALHGDLRNPHSLNLTYLHQRWKGGNKSYPSETKTVQILLWPGRRPSFHFDHFETFSSTWYVLLDLDLLLLHLCSQRSSSDQGNPVALRPGPSPRNAY